MWNRRVFLQNCMVGAGVLSGAAGSIHQRILAAVRDTAGMSPEQAASGLDVRIALRRVVDLHCWGWSSSSAL